jgi:DNA mismatch repair protein MSH2
VKEAIVPTGTAVGTTDRDIDLAKLKALLDRCGVVVTERKPSESKFYQMHARHINVPRGEFTVKNLVNDLPRLIRRVDSQLSSSADSTLVICR